MLITFSTPSHADLTFFGDIAIRLLKMMGHSGTVPSAILAEDVPAALEKLRHAVAAHGDDETGQDDGGEESVSLAHRAMPLIGLLETAAREEEYVTWRAG